MTAQEMLAKQEELRSAYLKLFAERDEILVWKREMLTAIYTTSIGSLRMEIFQMQLKIKVIKSQIKLVHDLLHVDKEPLFDRIDAKIKIRLAEVDKQFSGQMKEVDKAYDTYLAPGAKKKADELRKHFVAIAAMIHPDMFMEPSFEQRRMWEEARETYSHQDLGRLKSLELICQSSPFPSQEKSGKIDLELLDGHINRLEYLIEHMKLELGVLRESYPFTMEEQLLNANWVKSHQEVDRKELQKLKDRFAELQHEYELLKLSYGR